jgi:Trypsin-like peptidase domain
MAADMGPGAVVGWLRAHGTTDGLAGCAFLISPDIVLTCAHVLGAHLGLPKPVPTEPPTDLVTIRFEALQDEVTGHVSSDGWFSNARAAPGELSDIAVVRLNKPVQAIAPLPAIGQRMPTQGRSVLIHGAEADYKSYGQQVDGEMSGSNIPRGWRQINPRNSAKGFNVESGFSGSPVLDDLGNVVWGMIVAVAEKGSGVAYAIPAENLWAALRSAGAETTVRLPDATDQRAEEAMAQRRGIRCAACRSRVRNRADATGA